MKQAVEPWRDPATFCVRGGGSRKKDVGQTIGNNGTQSQRLRDLLLQASNAKKLLRSKSLETRCAAATSYARSVAMANRWKRRDRKARG